MKFKFTSIYIYHTIRPFCINATRDSHVQVRLKFEKKIEIELINNHHIRISCTARFNKKAVVFY